MNIMNAMSYTMGSDVVFIRIRYISRFPSISHHFMIINTHKGVNINTVNM